MSNQSCVYTIFLDIIGFSTKIEEEMEAIIIQFNNCVLENIGTYTIFNSSVILPTGDGCLIVTDTAITDQNSLAVLNFVINLHKNLRLNLTIKKHVTGIRIGVHCGKAAQIDIQDRKNYVGLTINECQRIMDFCDKWHILTSDDFVNSLPEKGITEKDKQNVIFEWANLTESNILKDKIIIKKIDYLYYDKHETPYLIYNIYNNFNYQGSKSFNTSKSQEVGNSNKPPFRFPKSSIDENLVGRIRQLLKKCKKFYSISRMSPTEWLSDVNLIQVLIEQAKFSKANSKFIRIFIWNDDDIYHKSSDDLFIISNNANIHSYTISPTKAKQLVDTLTLPKLSVTASTNKMLKKFIEDPLQELYIAIDSNESEIGFGYGVREPNGTHKVTYITDLSLIQYGRNLFQLLTEHATRRIIP